MSLRIAKVYIMSLSGEQNGVQVSYRIQEGVGQGRYIEWEGLFETEEGAREQITREGFKDSDVVPVYDLWQERKADDRHDPVYSRPYDDRDRHGGPTLSLEDADPYPASSGTPLRAMTTRGQPMRADHDNRHEYRDRPAYATTQQTAKQIKVHYLSGWASILLGIALFVTSANDTSSGMGLSLVGMLMLIGGITWLMVTSFRRWWHHG
jgi:hypothetical protein